MDVMMLYNIVESHFGYRAHMLYFDRGKKEVACMLYNSFLLKCSLDDRYGRFGAGLMFGEQQAMITEFLGRRCSLNSDRDSISSCLEIVDDYCRLRLPDKFLDAYEVAYNR